jgi:LmbE family N-acetylglucosaminyl deacetylase
VRPGAALVALALALTAGSLPAIHAQQLGPSTGGLGALDQALRFLGHHKRVLMVAAHPDDEDTELLTVLVRGMGAEAAYLSVTRGEGGQNLIGQELGQALGVLRTGELLAARRLDGARQYFTRAFDFGYSKTLDDTWRFWPRDSVLKDVVRLVRRFRPQVMVSIFSGTPRDGHGQHQAAGWAAREAFRLAGDADAFPELEREEGLHPWTPLKLFQSARFDPQSATVTLEGGVVDAAIGQSFRQIAMRGRSLHRSQDMGAPQSIGPSPVRVRLVEDRTGAGEGGFFAGIDTSLASMLPGAPAAEVAKLTTELRRLRPWNTGALPTLRGTFAAFLERLGAGPAALDHLARLDDALFLASGVLCDAVSDQERVVPESPFRIALSCWNPTAAAREVSARLLLGGREAGTARWRLAPGQLGADTIHVHPPGDMPPTAPYFLEATIPGTALYVHSREPFERPAVEAEFITAEGGRQVHEVVHRYVDQAIGEVRRPVVVVPRVSVHLDPPSGLWPVADTGSRPFTVTLRHHARDTTAGQVRLEVPPTWRTGPAVGVLLAGDGATMVHRFLVRPPERVEPGDYRIRAVVDAGGRQYGLGTATVEYPHVRPRQLVRPAESRLVLADLRLPVERTLGYVRGAADQVPEALSALGLDVVLLSADSLARGHLARFRTIVIGPRAYETEPAVLQSNDRLLAFVRQGGTLVVQYQQQAWFRGGYAPYGVALTERGAQPAFRVVAPRVAEEDAPVRVLAPDDAAFREPNRIGPADWNGWVQERGLYFARAWDEAWQPLLEMADTGEPPQQGGLLVARIGRGVYVYTGLSFFRQLPAAVPGAARLLLNLLAMRGNADQGR